MSKKKMFSLAEVAERWGCSHSSVLTLVYQGVLLAVDISTNPGRRSRFVVPEDALDEFEARRTSKPPEPEPVLKRKRVKVPAGAVIEFFQE